MATTRRPAGDAVLNARDIVSRAAAIAASTQRQQHVAAVQEWRDLVFGIADGIEPGGATIQRMAELSAELGLPRGTLADHVAAVQEDRRLCAITAEAKRIGDAAQAASEKLVADLRDAEERAAELRAAVSQNYFDMQSGIFVQCRVPEHREKFPLLFGDLDAAEAL